MNLTTTAKSILLSVGLCGIFTLPSNGQKSAAPAPSAPSTPSPSAPSSIPNSYPGTNNTPSRNPNSIPNTNQDQNPFELGNRPVFIEGRVVLDDGGQPDREVRIERVCGTTTHFESHIDNKGRFSFQVGQQQSFDVDASNSDIGQAGRRGNGNFGGSGIRDLRNCEIRASYPGYRSDAINLAGQDTFGTVSIGTIVLHRLANVSGTVTSVTTMLAPKHARKEYEKGIEFAQKGKMAEAEQHLTAATDEYPQYAIAWFALGRVKHQAHQPDEAQRCYENAAKYDSHYVSPLDASALLAAEQQNWTKAAEFSKKAIDLNSVEFPTSLWYNAIANYNLKRPADAEARAKQLVSVDSTHRFPEAESLLAQIALDRGQTDEAVRHMRAFLALAPNSKMAESVKQTLVRLDPQAATAQTH